MRSRSIIGRRNKNKTKKKGYIQTHKEPVMTQSDARVDNWRMSDMSASEKKAYKANKKSSKAAEGTRKGYDMSRVKPKTKPASTTNSTPVKPPKNTKPLVSNKARKEIKANVAQKRAEREAKVVNKRADQQMKKRDKKKESIWSSITGSGWKQGGAKNYANYEEIMNYAEGGQVKGVKPSASLSKKYGRTVQGMMCGGSVKGRKK